MNAASPKKGSKKMVQKRACELKVKWRMMERRREERGERVGEKGINGHRSRRERGKELISEDGRRSVGVVAQEGAELTEKELARTPSLSVDATTKSRVG